MQYKTATDMTPKQAIGKIAAFIERLPTDTKLNYFAGLLLSALCSLFLPALIAVAISVVVGILKEVYDKVTKKGTPELSDFLWTTAGALTWLCLYCFVSWIICYRHLQIPYS